MEQRLVVAVPVAAGVGSVDQAAGDAGSPGGGLTPSDLGIAAELVGDSLFAAGARAVAQIELDGLQHLVADVAVDRVHEIGRPYRVLEPDRSWTDGWREHAKVWRAGRFVVRPPWLEGPRGHHDATDPAEVEVVVDPRNAFGSGSHPSTRGCLLALDRLLAPGDRVLDVGCGSGVLGVAALLAGASEVLAIDVDAAAVAATAEVARDNGVADRMCAKQRPLHEVDGAFDLVLANLLIPVVEELGPELVRVVDEDGRLVVAGLLGRHLARARDALRGLSVESAWSDSDAGWWVLVLGRPS